ncbi:hypothetical protein KUTeg_006207 [Tegillarca granosa]|uniref:Novel STAND NTPase 3 domain-containing protein n=1 Tax=Tegillarca granosa TaxID=220873 RepID=A0ABQ9FFT0_TEGGR|nr:hypothetical protein KUTeg_006207 [Tegillarca granosa]
MDEILQYWMPAVSQVFIYDDPFGIQGIDEAEVNVWRKKQDTLKIFFQNSCMKILISIRSVINKNIKIEKLIDHESISHKTICLTDENIKLNQNEKREIFKKHHKYQDQLKIDNIVTEIINLEDTYFPLLCKIFGFESDFKYATVSFFKDPLSVFENVVAEFQSNDGLQYFCLLLCMINDNEISLESLDCTKEEATFQSLMDDLLDMCNLERSIPKSEITNTLQRLENTFLVKDGCNYHFAHSCIHDAVLKHIVKSSEEVHGKIIKHCSAKFLRTRVYLKNMNTTKETCIVIAKSLESCWGKRIIDFIEDGSWHDVFHNACLSTEKGDEILNAELKNISPSEIQMIMCNSKRNEMKVNLNVLDGSYNIDEQLEHIKSNALHFTVLKGLFNVVTTTLKSICFAAKQKTNDHINLFLLACASGKEVLVKTLLSNTPTNSNSVSPLFISCFHGHENIVKYLLSNNISEVGNCTKEGKSPLYVSAEGGHNIVAKLLIENKAEVNKCTNEGMSPLFVSAAGGHEKVVQLLMDKGVEVNKCTSKNKSPLYISAAGGHEKVVKMLIDKGAEINKCTSEDKSPLYISAAGGHDKVVKMLIDKGAEINKCTSEDKSPLYISAAGGHNKVVKMLIDKGADVNKCAVEGKSPLYVSAAGGHDMVVKQLIENTGEVNQCTSELKSPLYISAAGGHEIVVQQLIESKADVNRCSLDDKSPLYVSAKAGHDKIVKLMIENKAEVNKCTSEGKSPLYISAARGYDEVVKLLIDNKAEINRFTNYGETPLFVSAFHGHEKVVKLLIEKGADVNISTMYGRTPLDVTSNYKIKEMLINKEVQTKESNA